MGKMLDPSFWEQSPPPQTGDMNAARTLNQRAIRELPGALQPEDVVIQDGKISGFASAALVVDTEGGAAADNLDVINIVLSANENLHPGMLITLRAKDPARVVTVKNSASANGINTADGNDIVLSPDWELTLRLVGGRWYEVRGRSSALADAAMSAAAGAQSTANAAKAVTDTVTPTPTANAVPQAGDNKKIAVGWIPGLYLGKIEFSPFAPADLATWCPGWYFTNGDQYALSSAVGQALAALPTSYKTAWGIVVSGSNISIPKLFSVDGRGVHLRAVDGTTRQVGSLQNDAIRNITGAINGINAAAFGAAAGALGLSHAFNPTVGSTAGAGVGYLDITFSASNVVPTADENRTLNAGMTPAIFLGV